MNTELTPKRLVESVLAVPPLCRNADLSLNPTENQKLIRHIESGGITTLLYGGNANFYHLPLSEYDDTLGFLAQAAGPDTLVIPSAGPAYGTMIDQARILRGHKFPTVMVLPQQGITTSAGIVEGVRRFVDAAGLPALLYIKNDGFIDVDDVAQLAKNNLISGIGEQPAIVHLRDFELGGFTSGCVCINPALSAQMLDALRRGDYATAERIRQTFKPLEDLRNAINPIRVLHEAVRLAGIADTGPALPLLTNLEDASEIERVAGAAKELHSLRCGNEKAV
jgi:dihydrodipicolinate synthase/N-acetylneuraminate lyase